MFINTKVTKAERPQASEFRVEKYRNPMRAIREFDVSDKELYTVAAQGEEPFVVRNYSKALTEYGIDFYVENYGDRDVKLLFKEERHEKFDEIVNHYETRKFAEYAALIEGGKTNVYMAQSLLKEVFPELYHKLPVQDILRDHIITAFNVWIGPKGTKSCLHFDTDPNYLIQAQGRKEVHLVDPRESQYCYLVKSSFHDGFSNIDTYEPDYEAYPEFAKATIHRSVLNPGDMLFIPINWWHDIHSLDPSVSYNIWWSKPKDMPRRVYWELRHRLRAALGLAPALEKKNSYLYSLLKRV